MSIYSNIRVVDYGFFQHSRCFLDTFDEKNDINSDTKRAGIRCHGWFTAMVLKIFGKIEKVQTSAGEKIYLNKGSFEKWRLKHAASLPAELKTTTLPTASSIIAFRHQLANQSKEPDQKTGSLNGHTVTVLPKSETTIEIDAKPNPSSVKNIDTQNENETEIVLISPKSTELSLIESSVEICESEKLESPSTTDEDLVIDIPQNLDTHQTAQTDEVLEKAEKTERKVLSVAKRWGLKIAPAVFPELKVPLAVLKSGSTVIDAVDCYQKGNAFGAIKKVAPLAIGGALMLYGGPFVAAGFAAYKAKPMG